MKTAQVDDRLGTLVLASSASASPVNTAFSSALV
jgi:hypothetical protein